MNLYFLVEGRRTEAKIYPAWLSYLVPQLQRVKTPTEANENNYYLVSAGGYPSIKDTHIPNSIADIQVIGTYNYFVICLDADESTVEERRNEILDLIETKDLALDNTELVLIIQNRCIETWFLGNRRIYVRTPQNPILRNYNQYYNVLQEDPELMGKHTFATHAQFHHKYLKATLAERNTSYTKHRPGPVLENSYLNQLLTRTNDNPTHLVSFQSFINFCAQINSNLTHSM